LERRREKNPGWAGVAGSVEVVVEDEDDDDESEGVDPAAVAEETDVEPAEGETTG